MCLLEVRKIKINILNPVYTPKMSKLGQKWTLKNFLTRSRLTVAMFIRKLSSIVTDIKVCRKSNATECGLQRAWM